MPRPKVSKIVPQPPNRIAELMRRARERQSCDVDDDSTSTIASTLREILRVLDNDAGETAGHTHSAGIDESCPICWAMELCAGELSELESAEMVGAL